jgi:hypothetical protein
MDETRSLATGEDREENRRHDEIVATTPEILL